MISAVLCIGSFDLSYAIEERMDAQQSFTTVTDADPQKVVSNGLALVCLNKGFGDQITHICLLKKGQRVATNQIRLKGTYPVALPDIDVEEIIALIPKRFKKQAHAVFNSVYTKISPKFGELMYNALLELCDEQKQDIIKLKTRLDTNIPVSTKSRITDAAAEKDALSICLDIFGVNRAEIIQSWNLEDGNFGDSFLSGLSEYVAYEDDVISNDLHQLPGYTLISEAITGVVEFENREGEKLIVINAKRKPQEKAMGVDLNNFHRNYEAFTFVQYKMMDQKSKVSNEQYYNPKQKSHGEELARMEHLQTLLDEAKQVNDYKDYRFSLSSIYFKLCKKIEMKKADSSIVAGAYIPLKQWKMLLSDPSTKGDKNGIQMGYHTINNRYLGTATFVDLIKKGFIGTQKGNLLKIAAFIESAVKEGHSVIYAIDNRKEKHGKKQKKKSLIDVLD
jgi:hypothetical protein